MCHAMATICTFLIAHTTFRHFFFFSLLVLLVYNLHVFKPDTVNKGEGEAV